MAIHSFLKKNKKFSKVVGLAFVAALVVGSILFVNASTEDDNAQNVGISWINDNAINCHKPLSGQPDSALQNGVLNWTAQVQNSGPGSIVIEKAAFHDPKSGCTSTTHTLNQNIFAMSGKTSYAQGESGQVVFTYDTGNFNCGRVQVDAAYRNANGSGAGAVFMGEMIDYGVDCVATPVKPTVTCPTLRGPVTGLQVNHAATDVHFYWNAANGANTYILDISEDANFAWHWNNGSGAGGGIADTTATFSSATNAHYAPGRTAPVTPVDGKTYYWRVYAYNAQYIGVVPGCHSEVRAFTIENPPVVTPPVVAPPVVNPPVAPAPDPVATPNPNPTPSSGGGSSNVSIKIEKVVKNLTVAPNASYKEIVEARKDEVVEFQIVVTNKNSRTAKNVKFEDNLPSELEYVTGTLYVDGVKSNSTITNLSLGDIASKKSKTITLQAKAKSTTNHKTVTNRVEADGSNTSRVTDTAQVNLIPVQSSNVSLTLHKSAYNVTQGKDATKVVANAGDVISYSLKVTNKGSSPATGFVVEDYIGDVLQLSDMNQMYGGKLTNNNQTVVWDPITVPANLTMEKTFTVVVKKNIPADSDYLMTNLYGNEVNVQVYKTYVAPATGPVSAVNIALAVMSVAGFAAYQLISKRRILA